MTYCMPVAIRLRCAGGPLSCKDAYAGWRLAVAVLPMQIYKKSMEYPPKFGRNANLKLGIK